MISFPDLFKSVGFRKLKKNPSNSHPQAKGAVCSFLRLIEGVFGLESLNRNDLKARRIRGLWQ